MKIEQLPSGSYRLRKTSNKIQYTLIVAEKPTKKDAERAMKEYIATSAQNAYKGSFEYYAQEYVTVKKNVLSPSTVRSYDSFIRIIPRDFMRKDLNKITQEDIQILINKYAADHSPKTVRNISGFVSAVLGMYRPAFHYKTTLPQKKEYNYYIPTSEEIRAVLAKAAGTEYDTVLRLGCYGLRRSEALAITGDSIDGNALRIDSAIVKDTHNKYVEKTTKTTKSTRTIYIDDSLANDIKRKGYAYKGHPNNIIQALHRFQKAAGVPPFRYHDLRHYFATEMCALIDSGEITRKDAEYLGGWSSSYTLENVYNHTRADRDAKIRQQAAAKIANNIGV